MTPPPDFKNQETSGMKGFLQPTRASFETIPSLLHNKGHHQGLTI